MADDLRDASLGLSELSLGTDHSSSSVIQERTNFPIPRELRDQVYSYLLFHEHVHDVAYVRRPEFQGNEYAEQTHRATSLAHTHRFHVNILAVNRSISHEALQVLINNNFVIVTHQVSSRLAIAKHNVDLPIVTQNQSDVAKFKHQMMALEVRESTDFKEEDISMAESFVMVAKDLPHLCKLFQWQFYCTSTPATFVIHMDGTPSGDANTCNFKNRDSSVISTTIRFKNKDPTTVNPELARTILAHFSGMVIGMQEVKIGNAPDYLAQDVQALKSIMTPKSVWPVAIACNMLETLQGFKRTADDFVRTGNTVHASKWYNVTWMGSLSSDILHLPNHLFESDLAYPLSALCSLFLNAAITDGFLSFRSPKSDLLSYNIRGLQAFVEYLKELPLRIKTIMTQSFDTNKVLAQSLYLNNMYYFVSNRTPENIEDVFQSLGSLRGMLSSSEHFQHDYKLVTAFARNQRLTEVYPHAERLSTNALIRQTAAWELPLRVFDTPMPANCTKPSSIVGLVDTVHAKNIQASNPKLAEMLAIA